MLIAAGNLTDEHIGRVLVLGKNSKKKRGQITALHVNSSMARIELLGQRRTAVTLPPEEEVELEW